MVNQDVPSLGDSEIDSVKKIIGQIEQSFGWEDDHLFDLVYRRRVHVGYGLRVPNAARELTERGAARRGSSFGPT